MKIPIGTQLKLGLFFPMIFVIVLGIYSYIQSNEHYRKTEILYSNTLMLERSFSMLKTYIISLHRDMKDISIDSTEKEIDIELLWIKWWQFRASGQIDTIYQKYAGNRSDIDSLSRDYAVLNSLCENTIELMRSGKRNEVLNRTKTNGIISENVERLLAKLEGISNLTIKKDDDLHLNLVQLGNAFNRKMLQLVILILLFSLIISFIMTRNFTKLKLAEEALKESGEKLLKLNHDKDRFISILGHDLKNPFNNILGFSEVLTEDIRNLSIDEIEEIAKNINNSARITEKLLEEILMWAKMQQGRVPFESQNLSFTDICTDTIKILVQAAAAKNISIKCHVQDQLYVFADSDMLKVVLRNLISNAIKFTNTDGAININAKKNSENVTISVSDNGVGIPPDNLAKLFDISQVLMTKGTAEETGTGLGLLLCKEFVERHGGKIWVESTVGNGSDFIFTLPYQNN